MADAKGTTRAGLAVTGTTTTLELYPADWAPSQDSKKIHIVLDVDEEGAGLRFKDQLARDRCVLAEFERSGGGLLFFGADGKVGRTLLER
jgi:hypothetical protein